MTSLPCGAEWRFVPAGWTAPEPGYWGTEAAGRDTLSALRTYREERDTWRQGYEELQSRTEEMVTAWEARIRALEDSISEEREGWKRELRRAKGPGFGVFAGYGFDHRGEGDFVAGVGLVWKVF